MADRSGVVARLGGAFPAVVTPFHEDETLDLESLCTLLEWLFERGIRGFTLLGSSAENTYLTPDERSRIVECAKRQLGDGMTLLAGVISFGTRAAVEEGKRLRDCGADALLVALPQYYVTPLPEVIAHYGAIVRDVGLPVLYYHYPDPTHLRLTPEEVARLFAEVDVSGIKNSNLDIGDLKAQLAAIERPIRMFAGQSFSFLEALKSRAVGAICPVTCLMPKTSVALHAAFEAGDLARANELQSALFKALPAVMPEPGPTGPVGVPHAGVKEALVSAGLLRTATVRLPQPGLSERKRLEVRALAQNIVEV
jgi:dihydrodipicolinate synthase/N-acetylneuraminate lyase